MQNFVAPEKNLTYLSICKNIFLSAWFHIFHCCCSTVCAAECCGLLLVFATNDIPSFEPWPWSSLWARNKFLRLSAGRASASMTSCHLLWGAAPPRDQARWWKSRRSSPAEVERGWKCWPREAPTGKTVKDTTSSVSTDVYLPVLISPCLCLSFLWGRSYSFSTGKSSAGSKKTWHPSVISVWLIQQFHQILPMFSHVSSGGAKWLWVKAAEQFTLKSDTHIHMSIKIKL